MQLVEMEGALILQSEITCPYCDHKKVEKMPVDACECFYDCVSCSAQLQPREGECCIYCCYGSTPCPSTQEGRENRSC